MAVPLTGQVQDSLQLENTDVQPVCRPAAGRVRRAWLTLSDQGLLLSGVGVPTANLYLHNDADAAALG